MDFARLGAAVGRVLDPDAGELAFTNRYREAQEAARKLTMMKHECSHVTYRRWLGAAVQHLDTVISADLPTL